MIHYISSACLDRALVRKKLTEVVKSEFNTCMSLGIMSLECVKDSPCLAAWLLRSFLMQPWKIWNSMVFDLIVYNKLMTDLIWTGELALCLKIVMRMYVVIWRGVELGSVLVWAGIQRRLLIFAYFDWRRGILFSLDYGVVILSFPMHGRFML
jgi:hypothetical protein